MILWGASLIYSLISFRLYQWQYYSILFTLCAWGVLSSIRPSIKDRLTTAIDLSGGLITQRWFTTLDLITIIIKTFIAIAFTYCIVWWPTDYTPADLVYSNISQAWAFILKHYDTRDIFVKGVFFSHLCIYWSGSLLYALVDFLHTKSIKIYKVQDSKVIPFKTWVKCTPLIVFNEALAYVLVNFTYDAYNTFNYNGFSPIVPDVLTSVFTLASFAFISELWFYTSHRVMHASDFLWKHVHSVHHQITAPSVYFSLYTHPIEYIFGNFITLAIGPVVMGSHFLLVFTWVVISTLDFCSGHAGWHLPFGLSPEFHDYHHRHETGNYGTGLGIMDNIFGTNCDYKCAGMMELDKVYTTPDYSVDKVLKTTDKGL